MMYIIQWFIKMNELLIKLMKLYLEQREKMSEEERQIILNTIKIANDND